MKRTALLTLLLAAAFAPAAYAGEPFTVSEGTDPHLIVDAVGGTAHVVWADSVTDTIHTCEVPRGATACTDEETLSTGASADAPFFVRGGGETMFILVPRYVGDEIWSFRSVNAGATWEAPVKLYDQGSGTDATEPILNMPATEFIVPMWNPGRYVYSAKANGSDSATLTEPTLGDGGNSSLVYDLMVARAGATYIATAHDLNRSYFWTATDPSTGSGNWTGPTLIGDGEDTRLAGDGANAYMLTTAGPIGARRMEVRKWTGAAFGAPVTLASEQGYINDIVVNGAGTVGAIWRRNDSPPRLRLGRSTDGGSTWNVTTIAREDVVMGSMDIALANDNEGFAVYEGHSTPSSGAKVFIRLVNTDTAPEPAVAPTPTSTTTAPPVVTPPSTLPPTPQPVPLIRRVTAAVKGATLTLGAPNRCIPAGRPFVVTLTWKKQRRKGNLFVKVRRTDFYIGRQRLKIDRKAPFRQTLRIPRPRAGQSYRLRAQAFIKMRRGKSPKKSIVTTLKVCA